jgi:hypothetical protein
VSVHFEVLAVITKGNASTPPSLDIRLSGTFAPDSEKERSAVLVTLSKIRYALHPNFHQVQMGAGRGEVNLLVELSSEFNEPYEVYKERANLLYRSAEQMVEEENGKHTTALVVSTASTS